MGYTSSSYRQVPKASIPVYPQLQKYDFTEGCVDVMKIYEEVKQEKLNMEQGTHHSFDEMVCIEQK